MTVKVLVMRRIPQWNSTVDISILPRLSQLLMELRNMAIQQPGYISGETLRNMDDRNEYMVISTWKSRQYWERWLRNRRRIEVESQINNLLGTIPTYSVYSYD